MSEHVLKIEFEKPTYNLDIKYDGDYGLDLFFSKIKGSFYMTMQDSYQNEYFEDEECNFSNGELKANLDLTYFMDRLASNDYRATDGKARYEWIKRLCGDVGGKNEMTFDGYNCYEENFWESFFKKMPKDEINDFMDFCRGNIELPNLEVDTISQKWDLDDDKVVLDFNRQYSITINDDYTIESAEHFECDSIDATDVYLENQYVEDDFEESTKKTNKKSIKESVHGNGVVFEDFIYTLHDNKCFVTVFVIGGETYEEYVADLKKICKENTSLANSIIGAITVDAKNNLSVFCEL